jgi:RND family efflux transporter MFP subunit
MSPDRIKTPSRRLLMLTAAAALAAAGAVAGYGIISRADANRELVQWTSLQATPTVQLATLDHGGAQQSLTLPGNIQPYYKAPIYARVSGYLKSWQQDIGAHVTAGQVLASIDTPDLDQQFEQAKADLATATANAQLAAVTAARWTDLVKARWVSQQAADDKTGAAAATKAMMASASANVKRLEALESFKSIVAPFDGVVTQRNTDVGALINPGAGSGGSSSGSGAGQALFEVSDLHKVRIYVQVPQAFAGELRPGLKATFEMPQYPGQQFQASVVTTSNAMDAASRSMLVELQADNGNGKLAPGSYCQVHFQLPVDPNVVQIPATALLPSNKGAQVAVLGDSGKAVLKTVQLGRDLGDAVEVTAGLSPADRVIDSPPETLQTGDAVQLAAATSTASAGAQQASTQAPASTPAAKVN